MSDLVIVSGPFSDPGIQDKDNPRSLINLVPPSVGQAISRVPDDYLGMTESELATERGNPFSLLDRRLRTAFWIEYARAQDAGGSMNMAAVYNGICTRTHFYTSILHSPARLAYVLLPPADYRVSTEEALVFGVESLRECLEVAVDSFKLAPDPKMLDAITKVVSMFDQRVKGAVVQRIQQHNINESRGRAQAGETPSSMEELDKKLADLQAKATGKPPIQEVEVVPNLEE